MPGRREALVQRRSFIFGAATGLTLVAVSGCTRPEPEPRPTPTTTPDDIPIPAPAGMVRSSWSTEPFALGAFSYLGVGSNPDQRDSLARPVADRVFFAGEATSTALPGTVAGAWDSGQRAAEEIIAVADPTERIAIIGAGAAGAAAARSLVDAGFEVTVLEASERIGGRIKTVASDDWAVPVELGAARFDSATSPEIVAELSRLDIETRELDPTKAIRTPDGVELEESTVGADIVAGAIVAATALPGDVTLASALDLVPLVERPEDALVGDADWLQSYLRNDVAICFGADPDELSVRFGFADAARTTDTTVLGGFQKVVSDALDSVAVWTSNVVSEVSYGDEGVSIRFATGESLQADRVVITVPLGVLKSRDIKFEPQLPLSHTIAMIGLEVGTVDSIWLRFDEAFWNTDAVHWTVVGGDLDIARWVNLEPVTGSPILVGFVGADRAAALAELDDEEVILRARVSLEPFSSA